MALVGEVPGRDFWLELVMVRLWLGHIMSAWCMVLMWSFGEWAPIGQKEQKIAKNYESCAHYF